MLAAGMSLHNFVSILHISLYLCRRNLHYFSMKRTLTIRNFGAIRRARIELKDFNIFIGEQGSGKSTIAKLITIFDKQIASGDADGSDFPKTQLEEFNIHSYLQPDTVICYEWEGGEICIGAASSGIRQPANAPQDTAMNLYIPAERFFVSTFSRSLATLMVAKAPIPQTLLEFASLYEKAKNKYPNYQVPMLNLTFQVNEMNETLLLKESGRSIPFKESSSGIQSVVPLLMVVDYAITESSFNRVIVEEPELNLFPQTQVDLLHHLIGKCPQLTLTTHSPYLLSALNNLIEANHVLKLHPEKEKEVTKLIPKECMLDFDNVAAYKIENGEVVSIMDNEYRLIVADKIDEISDKESRIFSELLNME